MENRRDDDPGRREEDRRWLKIQEQVMNLVTTQRTNQQEQAKLETEVGRLSDHVEDVDEHLRGVSGKESMDTRVNVMEKEVFQHGVLLRQIAKHFGSVETMLGEMKTDVATFKIGRALSKESEGTRLERLKTWLSFWGPIVALVFGLVVPVGTLVFQHWDKLFPVRSMQYKPDEKLRKEIEADKKVARAKAAKKKLEAIEKERATLE